LGSPYNFIKEVKEGRRIASKIGLYDTTLRDGEQVPGVAFNENEKTRIAQALDELGVQRIEAGMPVVSPEDKRAVKKIANLGLSAEVWGFSRCVPSDIDACLECDVDAVICEIASSDLKIEAYGFKGLEDAVERAVKTLGYAKDHGLRTAFFPVDMTRASLGNMKRLCEAAVENAHVDEIVAVDTIGFALPGAIRYLVQQLKEWVQVPIHIHCHNDFGMGTACSLAAVDAGAEWVHVTVNGLGERAGNTDVAEVALSLLSLYDIDVGIRFQKLYEVSKLVEELSQVKMSTIKAVVGADVFKRETGAVIPQLERGYFHAVEPFPPELVGRHRSIVLGKKSGKESVRWKLRELGLEASPERIETLLAEVKQLSIKKKGLVSDSEFAEIVARTEGKS
jgi:isopropylmalate/homocitrate/citramalate synthase